MNTKTVGQLAEQFSEVCGYAPRSRNKQWLIKRIAWQIQANRQDGLTERALARARELANEADLRVMAPKNSQSAPAVVKLALTSPADRRLPPPGTVITRSYKGRELRVRILADGFEHEGERYRTLSVVAKHITGQHMNGFLFFRLNGEGGRS